MLDARTDASPREIEALKWVREQLLAGTLTHVAADGDLPAWPMSKEAKALPSPTCFNISWVKSDYPCGTVRCIGGWVAQHLGIGGISVDDYVSGHHPAFPRGPGLHLLYWENTDPATTPQQAAQAIDNFLQHNDPRWGSIMGGGEG